MAVSEEGADSEKTGAVVSLSPQGAGAPRP